MASDLVDGDYLGSYRKFIVDFVDRVNPNDQLPIKTSGHDVEEGELVGQIIHMTLQYLNQSLCPPSLQCYIVQLVIEEIKATCRKQPESCGFRQEEKTYEPLKLMQAVASKVNEICQRYLENSRLALLPPPPSTPMPLANAFAIRNNRRKMEDRHVILHDLNTIFNIKSDSIASYYAVFDGHAGYQAAVFCATHLHQYLAESPHYPTDPERALRDAFTTADNIFVQKSTRQTLSSGTTAVCALILNRKLYVAWVGDSQAALAKRGDVTQLVNPHKPDRNDEKERVEQMGGYVMHMGIWRVNGNLAVSRAIGDAQYKPYVTGDPEIRCITLDGDEDFLIIGCDGLWDCVTENEAAALVYRDLYRDPYDYESASQRLVEFAKNQGSIDNISVIVVFLVSPSKIASRSSINGNPLLADVQLDNMEPDNRFVSNANGQFDVNSAFSKQNSANNGSSDLMDDDDPYASYANKSANGKHVENGGKTVDTVNYNADVDDEDLGPETDVDAVDDASEDVPNLANVSRQLFPEKQDLCEIYQSEEPMDDETPSSPRATETNQRALIPEADNVGDSEDSEDEWNYYRIDPNKEKEEAAAIGPAISTEAKIENAKGEEEDVEGPNRGASSPVERRYLLDDEDNEDNEEKNDEKDDDDDSDSSSEPDSEREIRTNALIDNEISAEEKLEPIVSPIADEKVDDDKTEKIELEKDTEFSEIEDQRNPKSDDEEDMDFQLNPNAAEFVPVSPTPIVSTRMDLDAPIAGSPLKQTPIMDDIAIPSRREFENDVRSRPCEIEEASPCKNGDLFADFEMENAKISSSQPANLDVSEVSSTKAEFGDESIFLAPNESNKTEISTLDGSWTGSYGGFDDSNVDAMTKSFGPGDFVNLGNPVDLNAVHDLPEDDLTLDDNDQVPKIEDVEEKMNLENIQTSETDTESGESQCKEERSNVDLLSENRSVDDVMEVSSPSSPLLREEKLVDDFAVNGMESPISSMIEAEKSAKDGEKLSDDGEIVTTVDKTIVDDVNVTTKLLEMDLEDRGSQDCGFEKCNEKLPIDDEIMPAIDDSKQASDDVADFLSSPVPRDDFVGFSTSPVPRNDFVGFSTAESLPVESTKVENVEKISETFDSMQTNDDPFSSNTAAPQTPILLNPLNLHIENTQCSQDDGSFEDIPDYQVPKVADSPVDIISPLVQSDKSKNNPFETSDFGSEISFGDSKDFRPNYEDTEIKIETRDTEIPEISEKIEEPSEMRVEVGEIVSALKLSESLQEFTGLEEQLKPNVENLVSNGLETENLLAMNDEQSKMDVAPMEISEFTESSVERSIRDEPVALVENDENVEVSTAPEPEKPAKEETIAAVVATAAAVAAASTVAAVKSTKTKPVTTKSAVKSVASTKTVPNKSTPTSPTKPATSSRTSTLAGAKKTASTTTSAARPTKLETAKTASSSPASKTSVGTSKSAPVTSSKPTGRLSAASPRAKPATSSIAKNSTTANDKKPTTNGDATKSSSTVNKISATSVKSTTKPATKPTTTRLSSATGAATATTARPRTTSAAATSTVTKTSSTKSSTGTVGTTTQRPKTAPTGVTSSLAAKSRLAASTKSPITDKQIKETANKQISSSRTSTTTTASKTSRTSVSSSTATTTRRVATSKTASTTVSAVASQAVPPPIRKPAPITRPGGKNVVNVGAPTVGQPTTNGKNHGTKTVTTTKTKVVVENGVCTAAQESKIVTSTTSNDDEDVPIKDLSPVEPTTDNQLIVAAD